MDDIGEEDVGNYNLSQLASYFKQCASFANSKLSAQVKEESVKYSLKKTYIDVLNEERQIVLDKMTEVNTRAEIAIARIKAERGLISEQELKNEELSYEKSMKELEQKETDLKAAYRTLYTLIGLDENSNYQLYLEPTMDKLEMTQTLDGYINAKIATDLNIQQQINTVEAAETEVVLKSGTVPETIYEDVEADNTLTNAELTLEDQKTSLRNSIKSCYESIIALEESYDTNLKELENLNLKYDTAEKKYELQLITELELNETKQAVAEKENTIIGQIYEHMLLIEQFENTYLL